MQTPWLYTQRTEHATLRSKVLLSEVIIYCTIVQYLAQQSPKVIESKRALVTVYPVLSYLLSTLFLSTHVKFCCSSPTQKSHF